MLLNNLQSVLHLLDYSYSTDNQSAKTPIYVHFRLYIKNGNGELVNVKGVVFITVPPASSSSKSNVKLAVLTIVEDSSKIIIDMSKTLSNPSMSVKLTPGKFATFLCRLYLYVHHLLSRSAAVCSDGRRHVHLDLHLQFRCKARHRKK